MEFKVCRVCLGNSASISLFEQQEGTQYRAQIMKCVNVSIEEGDGLPDAMCAACAGDLAVSFQFALRCEASDRALRSTLPCVIEQTDTPDQKEEEEEIYIPKIKYEILETDIKLEALTEWTEYGSEIDDYQFSDSKNDLDLHSQPTTEIHKVETKKNRNKCKHEMRRIPKYLHKEKRRVYKGPMKCHVCGRVISCQSAYKLHMRSHTKEKPFSCDICKKSYGSKYTLKNHIYRHYNMVAKPRRKPKSHPVETEKDVSILCVVCGLKLKSPSLLEVHMTKHTGEKPFACSKCDKRFRLMGSLTRHFALVHRKDETSKYICDFCGKKFKCKYYIGIHLRIHTGEKPYSCPVCPKKFSQITTLIRHKRVHTGDKPFACKTCGKAFPDSSSRNLHEIQMHTNVKKLTCHICKKELKSKKSLQTHLNLHNNPKQFVCSRCGATFTTKGSLTAHTSRLHSEKAGMCTICNKEFPDIQAHIRIHSGEKPFVCKVCDRAFISRGSLVRHTDAKHKSVAAFKCMREAGRCALAFRTRVQLEQHELRAHAAGAPYACSVCARAFHRASDLSRHLHLNHDVKTKLKSYYKTEKTEKKMIINKFN